MKKANVQNFHSPGETSSSLNLKSILLYSLLFFIALIPRLLHLLSISDNPFFYFPIIDCNIYDIWAQGISAGHWLGQRVFWQAPLYPYFLALVYSVLGHDLFWARFIQLLLGSVNCLLIYKIAKSAINPKVAMVSFLLAAFYVPFLFFEAELLNPVLIIFFNLLLVWILFSFHHRPRKPKLLLAGIVLGLSSITHGLAMTFLPFAILWIFIILLRKKFSKAIIVSYCLRLVIGFLLVISVTLIRNLMVSHELVVISSNAGINFFIGNNPDYEKTTSIRPGIEWEELLLRPLQEGYRTLSEGSGYFFKQAFSYIAGEPFPI